MEDEDKILYKEVMGRLSFKPVEDLSETMQARLEEFKAENKSDVDVKTADFTQLEPVDKADFIDKMVTDIINKPA